MNFKNMNKNKKILLHLSLISGIGPKIVLKIIKKFFDDFSKKQINSQIRNLDINLTILYEYKITDLMQVFSLTENIAKKFYYGLQDYSNLEKELNLIEKHKIELLSFLDFDYPELLKEIYAPPIILYCRGMNILNNPKNIAVVGARKSNFYAKQVIENLIPELILNDWQVVSGGAIGADCIAHEVTLNNNGKTVAVLGSGLLNLYPSSNEKLFEKIVENNGCLISPFSLQSPPDKGNFPARNRIISGLSQGCLVVQAAKKSGALITAQFALEQGRQVFAVPGSIYDELSLGCHEIIKQGAKIVSCIDDILEEFISIQKLEKKQTKDSEKNLKKVKPDSEVKSEEDLFLAYLNDPITIDELSLKTGLTLVDLQDKLFDLQLKGNIKQNFAGSWQRI